MMSHARRQDDKQLGMLDEAAAFSFTALKIRPFLIQERPRHDCVRNCTYII